MPESPLAKKLKLKPAQRAAVIQAPKGYLESLIPLPEGVSMAEVLEGQFDWVQVFVNNKAELDQLMPQLAAALKTVSTLWISYPKGTSKIQTDLTRDKGWEGLKSYDLKSITLVSVNDTWSAFAFRPYRAGEEHQSFR